MENELFELCDARFYLELRLFFDYCALLVKVICSNLEIAPPSARANQFLIKINYHFHAYFPRNTQCCRVGCGAVIYEYIGVFLRLPNHLVVFVWTESHQSAVAPKKTTNIKELLNNARKSNETNKVDDCAARDGIVWEAICSRHELPQLINHRTASFRE